MPWCTKRLQPSEVAAWIFTVAARVTFDRSDRPTVMQRLRSGFVKNGIKGSKERGSEEGRKTYKRELDANLMLVAQKLLFACFSFVFLFCFIKDLGSLLYLKYKSYMQVTITPMKGRKGGYIQKKLTFISMKSLHHSQNVCLFYFNNTFT